MHIIFLGDSLDNIRAFPVHAKRDVGFQLDRLENGLLPNDWKPMKTIGRGVQEIRTRIASGAYRTIYVVKSKEAIYVLHAFEKKSQKTTAKDLSLAKMRYKELLLNNK